MSNGANANIYTQKFVITRQSDRRKDRKTDTERNQVNENQYFSLFPAVWIICLLHSQRTAIFIKSTLIHTHTDRPFKVVK